MIRLVAAGNEEIGGAVENVLQVVYTVEDTFTDPGAGGYTQTIVNHNLGIGIKDLLYTITAVDSRVFQLFDFNGNGGTSNHSWQLVNAADLNSVEVNTYYTGQ